MLHHLPAWFSVCALMVACHAAVAEPSRPDPAGTRVQHTPPTSGESDATPTVPEHPRVELLEPGAAPRRVLTYRIQEGSTARLRFWHEQQIRMATDAASAEPVRVPILVVLSLGPTSSTAAGAAHVPVAVEVMTLLPSDAPAGATRGQDVPGMSGSIGTYDLEFDGRVTNARAIAPEAAPRGLAAATAELLRDVTRVIAPLPAEPVGVGARWRVRDTATVGEAELPRVTTYTLTSLDEDGGSFEVVTGMHETGVEVAVCPSHRGTGSGRISFSTLGLTLRSRADVDYPPVGDNAPSSDACNHVSQVFVYETLPAVSGGIEGE